MNNYASHELIINVERLFTHEEFNTLKIKDMFYKIDRVSIKNTLSGSMVSVKGKVIYLGYKLEDGSFYDMVNEKYIPYMLINLNNGIIKECNKEIVKVLK